MKIGLFIFLTFIVSSVDAQNLDSLYNSFLRMKNQPNSLRHEEGKIIPNKCGFSLMGEIRENFDQFSPLQKETILQLRDRPILQKSIVSPSGLFRIHFDTTGTDIPGYDVNELAIAYDSVYNFEVNILGYPAPPSDGIRGGDDKYDIYISGKATADYGYTDDEVSLGNDKYISHIVMHNNFIGGFYTSGIDAAKATAAHEFHHAIQMGNYILRWSDVFYYELTSTAFEEFVFDDVNDYYGYISSFFRSTEKSLKEQSGYNLALWHIFLKERFYSEDPYLGYKIVKRSWELMRDNDFRAIIAIASATQEVSGNSFSKLFNEFSSWLNFTNTNAKPGQYFEEAINYPKVKSTYNFELNSPKQSVTIETNPTSINYLTFLDYSQGFADTIVAVLSNSDVNGSLGNNKSSNIVFTLASENFENGIPINDVYYSNLTGNGVEFVQSSFIINNELAENLIPRTEASFVYPQPFNYEQYNLLFLPTYPDITENAVLNIYSPDMNLVYSGKQSIYSNGNIVVPWNGRDNSGNKLTSGVYIFVTKANGKIKKGKFVILN